MLTAEQAYPRMPDRSARIAQRFAVGDRVTVGPAYRLIDRGSYFPDGTEGIYWVCEPGTHGDYKLAHFPGDEWVLWAHVTRLQASPVDLCPLCGEDRNHPTQHGSHDCSRIGATLRNR